MKVDKIKEVIAKRHGYQDNILGSRWGFAMQLTYRTKKQLQLYEEVIKELSERLEKTETKQCERCGIVGIQELKDKKCTKCGTKLFNSFSNTWHNENICGDSKKALSPSPDCG